MITGGAAAIVYGEPRLTRDIDIVARFRRSDAGRLAGAFLDPDFYVPPEDIIAQEIGRPRGHFNVIHVPTSLKADMYPVADDPFHAWALDHTQSEQIGGMTVRFAPPEYVIARKLEWFRASGSTRHLDDIRAILRVSGARISDAELQGWIARLGLAAEWNRVAGST